MKLDKRDNKDLFAKSRQKKSQSALDYTVFLVIIIATLLVMGYYIRNSLAQKHREAADTFGTGEVYRPHIDSIPADEWSKIATTYFPPLADDGSPVTEPSRKFMW